MIRTYTGISFTDFVVIPYDDITNGVVASVDNRGPFNVTISGSNSASGHAAGAYNQIAGEMSGLLDFDSPPTNIPIGAMIRSVECRVDLAISASASATVSPGTSITEARALASTEIQFGPLQESMPELKMEVDEIESGPGNSSVGPVVTDHFVNVRLFDFTSAPVTREYLVEEFSFWRVFSQSVSLYGQSGDTPPEATGSANTFISFAIFGIRITITYDEGPITMTVSPASGNVQVGQVITVTGPGAADQDYFFETEDGIIPVVVQVISPTEVRIETPYPASDPCFDCFPECPECDAAFAPCDADFGSEECQAAMQECLDCLTNCLEELEAAEECQSSTHEPPTTPVPVILIAGRQFGGNVPLGSFTIIYADGSGLYRFVLGKTNDTIYDGDRDGTTYDVKIPNPGGKTGFFRS